MKVETIEDCIRYFENENVRFNTPDTVGKIHTEGPDRGSSWHERHKEARAKQKPMRPLKSTRVGL